MNTVVISRLRIEWLFVWTALVVLAGAYVLRSDLQGQGLRATQLFPTLGYALSPLFYGAVAWLLYPLASLFQDSDCYLAVSGGALKIGRRRIPIADIEAVRIGRNGLRLRELVVIRSNGGTVGVRTYMLARRLPDVIAELQQALPELKIETS